jgi:DNA-binding transcriptional LysR family regulator
MANLESGSVTVSSSDTFCMYLFPAILEKFYKTYPGIAMNIANKTSSETRELLDSGDADIGIINLYGDNSKGLRIWKEYTIHDCFIVKKGTLDDCKSISISDLAAMEHIMLEKGTSTRSHIDRYFSSAGCTVIPAIELGSVELLLKFAAMGMGISCIAREFLEKSAYNGKVDIIPVATPVKQRSIGVVTLKGVPVSRATKAFLDIITEE